MSLSDLANLAKIESGSELTEGDRRFQYWGHVQFLLHAETYFHHHELALMPDEHWCGYTKFMTRYIQSPGFKETWDDIGPAFSEDFARWLNSLINQPCCSPAISAERRGEWKEVLTWPANHGFICAHDIQNHVNLSSSMACSGRALLWQRVRRNLAA